MSQPLAYARCTVQNDCTNEETCGATKSAKKNTKGAKDIWGRVSLFHFHALCAFCVLLCALCGSPFSESPDCFGASAAIVHSPPAKGATRFSDGGSCSGL